MPSFPHSSYNLHLYVRWRRRRTSREAPDFQQARTPIPIRLGTGGGKYRRTRLFVLTLGFSRKCVRLLCFHSSARCIRSSQERSVKVVFADTFYCAALTSPADASYGLALELSRVLAPDKIVTTDD